MERTIPYFKDVIVPQSLNEGKSVLVSSSENAIRGLLMHLCDIPTDQIHQVEIPTGLPMVFDWRVNRVRLLEDDDVPNPLKKYNFGAKPELLFKPEGMSTDKFNAIVAELSGESDSVSREGGSRRVATGGSRQRQPVITESNYSYHPIIPRYRPH
jgi:hypothetical protein